MANKITIQHSGTMVTQDVTEKQFAVIRGRSRKWVKVGDVKESATIKEFVDREFVQQEPEVLEEYKAESKKKKSK